MASIDHRYDNIIDFFQENPRTGLLRIYRKLTLTRLLHLQAEIRAFLLSFDSPQTPAGEDVDQANPLALPQQAAEPESQADSARDIWQTLKEYHELILLTVKIEGLQSPEGRDIRFLRRNLQEITAGTEFDGSLWDDDDDLVALFTNANEKYDRLTNWVFERLEWFHKYINRFRTPVRTPGGQENYPYNERAFAATVSVIAVLVAALFNVAGVYLLYFIDSMLTRLGIIVVYTFLFSIMMWVLTNAGEATVFSATAAYSAVLVVFIGNTNCN